MNDANTTIHPQPPSGGGGSVVFSTVSLPFVVWRRCLVVGLGVIIYIEEYLIIIIHTKIIFTQSKWLHSKNRLNTHIFLLLTLNVPKIKPLKNKYVLYGRK